MNRLIDWVIKSKKLAFAKRLAKASFFNSLFAQKLYNFLELLKKKWVNKLFVSRIREGEIEI